MFTLLSHYWREKGDPDKLTAALGRDWGEVLEGLPKTFIDRACIAYLRDEPRRRPTPGDIYQRARALMPLPKVVPKPEPLPGPERERVSAEAAERIMRDAGIPIKRFGGAGRTAEAGET